MEKLYLEPYDERPAISSSSRERHRQTTDTIIAGSNIFFARNWENYERRDGTKGLQVGDVIGIGLAPSECVPAWFVSSTNTDPNDFSFQLGIGIAGSEEPLEGHEAFFCTIDPVATPDDTSHTIPLGNDLREPKNMMRSNMSRIVQTFGETAGNVSGFQRFRSSVGAVDFEIMLTVLAIPTTWEFSIQWNWIFPVRSPLTSMRV